MKRLSAGAQGTGTVLYRMEGIISTDRGRPSGRPPETTGLTGQRHSNNPEGS